MDSSPTTASARGGLIREVRSLPEGDPSVFLRWAEGGPRGFWGRGDGWAAWAGEAAVLEGGPDDRGGRFRALRDGAAALTAGSTAEWRRVPPGDRPRFFGGFSFLDEDPADPVWEEFPTARFVLPRLALERRPGGLRLVAQGRWGEEARVRAALDEAEEALEDGGSAAGSTRRPAELDGRDDPADRERWDAAVERILGAIGDGRVTKAVLARIRDLELEVAVDTVRALEFLRRENARAHVFLLEPEPGRVFLGAAPEILAEYRGGRFEATAVAGSIGRGGTEAEDRSLADALLASAKDRAEHEVTVEKISQVLSPRLAALEVDLEPGVLTLARIQHLETRIRGRGTPAEDALSLVEALHPTPAVCGRPRDAALELIRAVEPFDRGWYAGPVGWFDPAGDGDFVPALRSAVGGGRRWRLFSGAGIVEGSDPEAEWIETALKFEPALRALGAGAAATGDGP